MHTCFDSVFIFTICEKKYEIVACIINVYTGKNNRFPFLDILGYLKNTHKNPNQGTWLGIPWLGLVSLCQIWDFCGYSLNTLKYPILGICYFFPCMGLNGSLNQNWTIIFGTQLR